MSPTRVNGSNSPSASELEDIPIPANLEADITQLTTLLSQFEPLSIDDNINVIELIRRLESADGVAQGVENKLDDILGKLDSLINSLEPKDDAVDEPVGQPPATNQLVAEETSTNSA